MRTPEATRVVDGKLLIAENNLRTYRQPSLIAENSLRTYRQPSLIAKNSLRTYRQSSLIAENNLRTYRQPSLIATGVQMMLPLAVKNLALILPVKPAGVDPFLPIP